MHYAVQMHCRIDRKETVFVLHKLNMGACEQQESFIDLRACQFRTAGHIKMYILHRYYIIHKMYTLCELCKNYNALWNDV